MHIWRGKLSRKGCARLVLLKGEDCTTIHFCWICIGMGILLFWIYVLEMRLAWINRKAFNIYSATNMLKNLFSSYEEPSYFSHSWIRAINSPSGQNEKSTDVNLKYRCRLCSSRWIFKKKTSWIFWRGYNYLWPIFCCM